MAIIRSSLYKPSDVFMKVPGVKKVEAVYNPRGKLTVLIASFNCEGDMVQGLKAAVALGWRAQKAYSSRTRGKFSRRIEVFERRDDGGWGTNIGINGEASSI